MNATTYLIGPCAIVHHAWFWEGLMKFKQGFPCDEVFHVWHQENGGGRSD